MPALDPRSRASGAGKFLRVGKYFLPALFEEMLTVRVSGIRFAMWTPWLEPLDPTTADCQRTGDGGPALPQLFGSASLWYELLI